MGKLTKDQKTVESLMCWRVVWVIKVKIRE
jgi:hypothetical protein